MATVFSTSQTLFRCLDWSKTKLYWEVFAGLANRLSSVTFVHNLAVMYNALEELSELSLLLQDRNTTLPRADTCLSRQVRVLKSMVYVYRRHKEQWSWSSVTLMHCSKKDYFLYSPPKELKPLLQTINTLVVSTAECERGFSQMNILNNTVRSSLKLPSLWALLFIKCVGPPLEKFSPNNMWGPGFSEVTA